MGAPRRNRRKYDEPKDMWNLQRIYADRRLVNEYGLRSMRELWAAQTEMSQIRGNVRELLSGINVRPEAERELLSRLSKLGVVPVGSTLDSLLDLKENALLERRLQTIVFRKGLARSVFQSRQLITHGFISVNGSKVDRPGYTVTADQEARIGYYKAIDIGAKQPAQEAAAAQAATPAAVQAEAEATAPAAQTQSITDEKA